MPGDNRRAADETVAAMRNAGWLEPIDSARVQSFLSLASCVDEDPLNASLWREFRAAEVNLRGSVSDDGGEDFQALIARIASVGNSADTKS